MKVAIYGLGYVGLTAVGCLTKEGHWVLGVDVSELKVNQAQSGKSPITEPGLDDLLLSAVQNGLLECTTNPGGRTNECDIVIVCVGTPSGPDGSHNMTYIADVSRQIAAVISRDRAKPLTVVYRSTIRPGTIEGLIAPIFKSVLGEDFDRLVELVYNPEFLREAVAISDYFAPPKIVIGTKDGEPNANMEELNKNIVAPVFYTKYREAEFTKFVDNTFHAVKVAFANEIGRVCLLQGISAEVVHKIFVSDTKLNVSPYYLRPGGPFGGSCLPKDVRALQYISEDVGGHTHLIQSLLRSNEAHKHFLYDRATRGLAPGAKVLVVGLAFKADSDDLRESPNVDLVRKLLQTGYHVSVYDPHLKPTDLVGQNLGYAFQHLPGINEILITKEAAEAGEFDVVVDTAGRANRLNLASTNVLNFSRLP